MKSPDFKKLLFSQKKSKNQQGVGLKLLKKQQNPRKFQNFNQK